MILLLPLLACSGDRNVDIDGDGFPADEDCADDDADRFPGSLEFCDGVDNDCDGTVDEDAVDAREWFTDGDLDSFGGASLGLACEGPPGAVRDGGDCADDDVNRGPRIPELCDGVDQDCDGLVDDRPGVLWAADVDDDGAGDPNDTVDACVPPEGFIAAVVADCDDNDPSVRPGAVEVCNDRDDDCDGLVDGPAAVFAAPSARPVVLEVVPGPGLALEAVELQGVDGDDLTLVHGDCAAGFTLSPVRFLDHWSAVGRPGPDADGIGILAAVLPGGAAPIDAQLYSGLAVPAGDVQVVAVGEGRALGSTLVDLHVTTDTVTLDVGPHSLTTSIADVQVRTPTGPASLVVDALSIDVHPAVGSIVADGRVDAVDAAIDVQITWTVFADRPEVWVTTTLTASAPTVLDATPTWADGVHTLTLPLSDAVRSGLFVASSGPTVGLVDVEPAGPLMVGPTGIVLTGALGTSMQQVFAAGDPIATTQIVVGDGPLDHLLPVADTLQPRAQVIMGAIP